jgi:hypothetical protein
MHRSFFPLLLPLLFGVACSGDPGKETGDTDVDPSTLDEDSDGVTADTDCDDGNADVFPGAPELCNDRDDDCDGLADEEAVDQGTFYNDADGDGHGDAASPVTACDQPTTASVAADDCNDTNPVVSPSATEICDAADVDEDCDGLADDADDSVDTTSGSTWYPDEDHDGYGVDAGAFSACDAAEGRSDTGGDCDDAVAAVNPGAKEVCDAADTDDDCDGAADDLDADVDLTGATTWYLDGDGDGYGDPLATTSTCDLPGGYVDNAADCDDTDLQINPIAAERCDELDVDENCDGLTDNEDGTALDQVTWYADADSDGFGDAASTTSACDVPSGYTADATDCDDTRATVYPGAVEMCDLLANDCDTVGTWTEDAEDGRISAMGSDGVWEDVTDVWSTGTDGAPLVASLSEDTTAWFCEGTYYLSLSNDAGHDISLAGPYGADTTILDASGSDNVLSTTGGSLTVEGLTLTGGASSGGAGINCLAGDLTVVDTVITGNAATGYGGGLYLRSCTDAYLSRVEISDNTASSGGGLYASSSSGLVLEEVEVLLNSASALAGGIGLSSSDFTATTLDIQANSAGGAYAGGGMWLSQSDGAFDTVVFEENEAGQAAGLYVYASDITMTFATFNGNDSNTYGAAMYVYDNASVVAEMCGFSGNESGSGGIVALDTSVTADFSASSFSYNHAGTAVLTLEDTVTLALDNVVFNENTPYDVWAAGGGELWSGIVSYTCTDTAGCY